MPDATKEDVKEAVQDVLDSRREFIVETPGTEVFTLYIASPSGEDIRKADWQYSKIYNQAIVDEFLTQAQMMDLLTEKGIVNQEYTTKLETVRISLGAELFKLETLMGSSTGEEKEITAMEVARLRDELFQLNQRVNGPMANTCENLAEDARTDFLTSRIIQKKDKTLLWKDFVAYKEESNTVLSVKARFEVMLWMQGLESNFLENTPEQSALREVAQTRLNQAIADQKAEEKELDAAEAEKNEKEVEDLELPSKPKVKKTTKKKAVAKKKAGRPKGSKGKPKKPESD